jgi:anti-sigma-K factor RskA
MILDGHVLDFIPAYALSCLDEDEAAQVSDHLKRCQDCQVELRAFQAVVDQLPLAIPQAEPSPKVKQMLLKRVEQDLTPEKQPSAWDRLRHVFKSVSPAWGLASLAIVAVLLISNLALWRQFNQLRSNPAATALRVVNLEGTQFSPGASGMIVMSRNGEYGTLVVDHLPTLSAQQQYQLWLIQDGKRTSGGVFSVSPEGYASLVVTSPRPLDDYSAFGITIEPAGGSPGPTGEKVLGGNL